MKKKYDFEVFVDNDTYQRMDQVTKALKHSKNLPDDEFRSLRREYEALVKESFKNGKIKVND